MQNSGRRRRVSTCISCYNRKQKCDRRYPCNHCTRRRRPEECVYNSPPVTRLSSALPLLNENEDLVVERNAGCRDRQAVEGSATQSFGNPAIDENSHEQQSTLLESFGYSEDSNSNTVALLKMLESTGIEDALEGNRNTLPSAVEAVEQNLDRMPSRPVLDFLIQYFVSDLNWMKQLVYTPSFLRRYQQWWSKNRPLSTSDAEFAVLFLRICSYAAHFLPSPSHTIDRIHGLSLLDIRTACSEVSENLAKACLILDWKGSLVRVQHILFDAIKSSCEGRTDQFWEGIASASQAAQKAGIQRDLSHSGSNDWELEKEMRRRVFCSLYILDSHLSRQLDRVPFLPDDLVTDMLPRMHLVTGSDHLDPNSGAPELFTERLMQVHLARFWRKFGQRRNTEYDPTKAEQNYEQFCNEYLPKVPPAVALRPDTQWDKRLPKLVMQRQILHIAIFDSICWNFRPLLLLKPTQIACLAQYKQVLLQAQKKILAVSALKELEAISILHSLFNGCHTRFAAIIFNTFEASVLLLTLCTHADFPFDNNYPSHFLGLEVGRVTRRRLIQAAENGLERLQMLAEVSNMAASGARTLGRLLSTVSNDQESASSLASSNGSDWNGSIQTTFPDLMGFDCDTSFLTPSQFLHAGFVTGPFPGFVPDESFSGVNLSAVDFGSLNYD